MSFKTIQSKIAQIRSREEGVTALEYALIAALIAVAVIGTVTAVGTNANATYTRVNTAMTGAN